jgi:hypothetical protein
MVDTRRRSYSHTSPQPKEHRQVEKARYSLRRSTKRKSNLSQSTRQGKSDVHYINFIRLSAWSDSSFAESRRRKQQKSETPQNNQQNGPHDVVDRHSSDLDPRRSDYDRDNFDEHNSVAHAAVEFEFDHFDGCSDELNSDDLDALETSSDEREPSDSETKPKSLQHVPEVPESMQCNCAQQCPKWRCGLCNGRGEFRFEYDYVDCNECFGYGEHYWCVLNRMELTDEKVYRNRI